MAFSRCKRVYRQILSKYCFNKCVLKNDFIQERYLSNVSSILKPTNKYEKFPCQSQTLMMNQGLIFPAIPGAYHILPLTVLSLEKLVKLVDIYMKAIGGQKIIMPTLSSKSHWSRSGRWDKMGDELLKLTDRNGLELCLGPTHEESVTNLVANLNTYSYKRLPLKIYQITSKFRDEARPKMGLLRGREFVMKDMYVFDVDQEAAEKSYNEICDAYMKVFKCLKVNVQKVKGSSGAMGGSFSHEFHILSDVGEDILRLCSSCDYGENAEIENELEKCPKCEAKMIHSKGIEVGHAFILGDMYSKALGAKFLSKYGKAEFYQMSCYGLGVSRMLAAFVESMSSDEEIRWPLKIAPFLIGVIPPKEGSKEFPSFGLVKHLAETLSLNTVFKNNTVFDDRTEFTIGKRLKDLRGAGIPYLIIAGKKACEDIPKFEIVDVYNNAEAYLTHAETMDYFRNLATVIQS